MLTDELKKGIGESLILAFKVASLYPLLNGMEERGGIVVRWVMPNYAVVSFSVSARGAVRRRA